MREDSDKYDYCRIRHITVIAHNNRKVAPVTGSYGFMTIFHKCYSECFWKNGVKLQDM